MIKKMKYLMVLLAALALMACGSQETGSGTRYFNKSLNDSDTEVSQEEQERESYLVVGIDSAQETMQVYRYANGLEYQYHYGMNTRFLNKYGDTVSEANFKLGDVIYLNGTDSQGRVSEVQKSDEVWVYDDVTRFSVDTARGVMQIGDDSYKIDAQTYVFNGDRSGNFDEISAEDQLCIVGRDKTILSVSVTTGHGNLKLTNTDLFEGSFLQLDTKIFVEISPDMEMEVPEGNYVLAVANNGWGGSKEITIQRGQTTEVNLDEIKGEGPKIARILFKTDVEGAQIYLDGQEIDYSDVLEVTYGAHKLKVKADGYDTWSRTLYVNSEEATIEISLSDEEESSESTDTEAKAQEPTSSSQSQTTTSESSKSDEISTKELIDYMSTISNLLGSM